MNNQPTYIVMGEDGKEYGPISAEQIRDWIRENRLERKTPVKPDSAKDWVFLEMLPEFADVLASVARANAAAGQSRKWFVIFLLLLLAAAVILALKQFQPQ
ncbi:MAG TPA: GYF domain-containing protein [Candidatus Binatia bacterium]|nr:GYF domain-containing protein [Candidatus Binatia bacterium]